MRGGSFRSRSFAQSEFSTRLLSTNRRDNVHRPEYVTTTVKLIEPVPVLPALSRADVENVCAPSPNEVAGPLMFAHVDDAMPDKASLAVQVIEIVSSTP